VTSTLLQPDTRPAATMFEDLRAHGARLAVATEHETLSYEDLAARVEQRAAEFGPGRRLILLAGDNQLESLITYLAALGSGHPLILVPGERPLDAVAEAYEPDIVCISGEVDRRPGRSSGLGDRDLHPDLALLLSTSGSTGSPKLVRLSYENVRANAAGIARFLDITDEDRAITTLPMYYCYGLSVINSHLVSGAALILTDRSIVDSAFWDLAREHSATNFAGVPYTFDLLDRSGFRGDEVPSLRFVTQAGGRMPPEQVARYAELGRVTGWELFVMYGQTEATARMAYLPPQLAAAHPSCIGIPIDGGQLRLEPVEGIDDPAVGELVYTGPNVMMGYATAPTDLRLGSTTDALRTGDLARVREDGLFEIVGRTSRFAKVYGNRIDLDDVERNLRGTGIPARCVVEADTVWVFVDRRRLAPKAADAARDGCGLPAHAVRAHTVEVIPATANGKVDYASLRSHAATISEREQLGESLTAPDRRHATASALRNLYAELLGRPDATAQSSFVSLGGDSLSYVELSVRLGDLLGELPRDWQTRSIAELAQLPVTAPARRPRRFGASLETSVLIRAVAIVLIVANHANLFVWYGGAHVLLGVAGFNFARFQLTGAAGLDRLRRGFAAIARIAVPSIVWIGVVTIATGQYAGSTALLLNAFVGENSWNDQWEYWFLEALVWTVVVASLALSIPAVGRLERRAPFATALVVLFAASAYRYVVVGVEAGPSTRYMPTIVFWCFALGWASARARTWSQRVVVTVAIVAACYGFFGDLNREATVAFGLVALLWLPSMRAPRIANAALAVLASSSLYVYLTHWQVYPHLEVNHPLLAVLASFAVGIAYWRLVVLLTEPAKQVLTRLRAGSSDLPHRCLRGRQEPRPAVASPTPEGSRRQQASSGPSRG
jgi:acyl-CoA synthetase (AMP-forming)/AMP-acid ligase II